MDENPFLTFLDHPAVEDLGVLGVPAHEGEVAENIDLARCPIGEGMNFVHGVISEYPFLGTRYLEAMGNIGGGFGFGQWLEVVINGYAFF
jgi:hypothetical protein